MICKSKYIQKISYQHPNLRRNSEIIDVFTTSPQPLPTREGSQMSGYSVKPTLLGEARERGMND